MYIYNNYIYAWVCYSLIFSREHRSYFWDIFLDGQCRPSRQPSRLSHAPLARASCYWWRRNAKAAAPRAASPMARRDEDWDERLKLGVLEIGVLKLSILQLRPWLLVITGDFNGMRNIL